MAEKEFQVGVVIKTGQNLVKHVFQGYPTEEAAAKMAGHLKTAIAGKKHSGFTVVEEAGKDSTPNIPTKIQY